MRPTASIALLVIALTLAACGGSDAPEPVDVPAAEDAGSAAEDTAAQTEAAADAIIEEGRATNAAAEAAAAELTEEASGVTLDKYNQLETGMSYAEVVGILGEEGTEMSRTDMMGIVTVMYMWDGKSFASNMNAMFQNDELVSKAQFGLE